MGTYTKGPWEVDGEYILAPNGADVVKLPVWEERFQQEKQANAALMAAAPELLEALEDLLGRLQVDAEGKSWFPSEQEAAKQAIAKAKGE